MNYLSKSIDKLDYQDDLCQIIDTDEYLNQSKENIKKILANAYLDQRSPSDDIRRRRQTNQSNNRLFDFSIRKKHRFSNR